jgi:osmotically-inducible protein OsmY
MDIRTVVTLVSLAIALTGCGGGTPTTPSDNAPAAAADNAPVAAADNEPAAAVDSAPAVDAAPAVPSNQQLADKEAQLRQLIIAKLGTDAEGIRVTLVGEKATLTGRVGERSTQELAKEVALTFPGVRKVDNQLAAVKGDSVGPGNLGNEAKDAKLEIEVKKAVSSEIGKYADNVEVEVVDGVVSLRGPVPDRARRDLALKAAKQVDGVRKVVDLLGVN